MKVYRFKCKDCGATRYEKVDENTYMCQYCGYIEEVHRQEPEEEEKPQEEKFPDYEVEFVPEFRADNRKATRLGVLLLVAIFAGTFGVHRFMQGKILSGLLYIFTFGLFGIGVFFDIVGLIIKLAHESRDKEYVSYRKVIKERDDND